MTRFGPTTLYIIAGMLVWTAAFGLAYGMAAVVCSLGFGEADGFGIPVLPLSIAAITVAALGLAGLIALRAYRRLRTRSEAGAAEQRQFAETMALIVALMAIVGIVWNGLPVLFLYGCA